MARALSPVELIAWLRAALDSPMLGKSGRLVAGALITYHNSQTGLTCPSIRTLARRTRLSLESVIDGYRQLEADGRLDHRARSSWADSRDRMSNVYILVPPPAPTAPDKPRRGHIRDCGTRCDGEVFGRAEHPCSETPNTPVRPSRTERPEVDTRTKNNDRPGVAPPIERPPHSRAYRLSQRVQQLAAPPGYRLATAVIDVGHAIDAAGIEAVEALAQRLQPRRGSMPVHEIRAALNGLTPPPSRSPSPSHDALRQLNGDTVADARRIYADVRPHTGAGVVDMGARMRIVRAVQSAGLTMPIWTDADSCILAIAQALTHGARIERPADRV